MFVSDASAQNAGIGHHASGCIGSHAETGTIDTIIIDGITVHVDGQGDETIVMVHGWPDTYRLWDRQVAHFRDRYRCVRFTLPGFDAQHPCDAYAFADVVDFLKKLIEQVSPERKVILLLHDWGCIYGYQLAMRHPHLVSRIIGVDVGEMQPMDASAPFKAMLMFGSYFSWLALAWRIGGPVGDWMTRRMAKLLGAPADSELINRCMNYPYDSAVTGTRGGYRGRIPFMPSCPTLYLYARRKPFMLHSTKWLDEFSAQDRNIAIALDTYHWPMLEKAHQFNATVEHWLQTTQPAA